MNYSKLNQYIEKNTWYTEEFESKLQYMYWVLGYVEQRFLFHPDVPEASLFTVSNGVVQVNTSIEESVRVFEWLQSRFEEDRGFLDDVYTEWSAILKDVYEMYSRIPQEVESYDLKKMIVAYREFTQVIQESARYVSVVQSGNMYSDTVLFPELKTLFSHLDESIIHSILITLSTPHTVSAYEQFEKEKAELLLNHFKEIKMSKTVEEVYSHTGFARNFDSVYSRYKWIPVEINAAPVFTQHSFLMQLREEVNIYSIKELEQTLDSFKEKYDELEHQQHSLLIEHDFPADIRDTFSILRILRGVGQDVAELNSKITYVLWKMLAHISSLTKQPIEFLEWYTFSEVLDLLEKDTALDIDFVRSRREKSVFVATLEQEEKGVLVEYSGKMADELYTSFHNTTIDVLKGFVAAKPQEEKIIRGVARVLSSFENVIIRDREIIIAKKASMDLVPLLKKTKGFITDEGGITSHAAIISREHGMPCIIGTRYATKLFKDGDHIEMHFETGEVRRV